MVRKQEEKKKDKIQEKLSLGDWLIQPLIFHPFYLIFNTEKVGIFVVRQFYPGILNNGINNLQNTKQNANYN